MVSLSIMHRALNRHQTFPSRDWRQGRPLRPSVQLRLSRYERQLGHPRSAAVIRAQTLWQH